MRRSFIGSFFGNHSAANFAGRHEASADEPFVVQRPVAPRDAHLGQAARVGLGGERAARQHLGGARRRIAAGATGRHLKAADDDLVAARDHVDAALERDVAAPTMGAQQQGAGRRNRTGSGLEARIARVHRGDVARGKILQIGGAGERRRGDPRRGRVALVLAHDDHAAVVVPAPAGRMRERKARPWIDQLGPANGRVAGRLCV
jgi:hypothetical protein